MILITIDNKNRDLPHLSSVGEYLALNFNQKIIFSNYYEAPHIIKKFKSNIQCVLLSYIKNEISYLLRTIEKYEIKCCVYDQEGCGGLDGLGVSSLIYQNKKLINHFIDGYFFWGSKQLNKSKSTLNKKIFVKKVGYIRFEKNKLSKVKNDKFFLINSNFAISSPKYSNINEEYKNIKKSGLYKKKLNVFFKQMLERRSKFYLVVDKLIKSLPNINFVLRPHPYETIEKALKISKKYNNCQISLKYNSVEWLKKCNALIHTDCQTSIEALFLNKPSLSIFWLLKNEYHFKTHVLSSLKFNNFLELKKKIIQYSNNQKTRNKNIIKLKKKIDKYYFGFFSKPEKNLAAAIMMLINKKKIITKKKIEFTKFENFKFLLIQKTHFRILLLLYLFFPLKIKRFINKSFNKREFESNCDKNKLKISKLIFSSFLIEKKRQKNNV